MKAELPEDRLYHILLENPYLKFEFHYLHGYLTTIEEAKTDPSRDINDLIDRLKIELQTEKEELQSAFDRFSRGQRGLKPKDLKEMHRYMGFPAEDSDIKHVMETIDQDGDGNITFTEFQEYVSRLGGIQKLFENRQKRTMKGAGNGTHLPRSKTWDDDMAELAKAGLDKEALYFWRIVVPGSEFENVKGLTNCQKEAVSTIRHLAKKNHQEALPKLQDRVHKLKMKDEQLWMTLAWIRELAPIILHVNLDKAVGYLSGDTHYRNQFETKTSGGLLKPDVRRRWERDLFSGKYDKASDFERPKYGVQNVMNDYRGVVKCKQYGTSYLVLKDVRLRCTFSPEDSANLKANRLAVLDYYAHVLFEYSDAELKETIEVANSADAAVLGDSSQVGNMKYKEAQIHGEIDFSKHVERLVADNKHKGTEMEEKIAQLVSLKGWAFSWMDEEQARMRNESMHKLGGGEWKERLARLEDSKNAPEIDVPEGFCDRGCGRRCAPGFTPSGNPFKTCCRGCVVGFGGHDRICGQVDSNKVGVGLCNNGCGRPIAPGLDAKGRSFTTCCRGCALGQEHDALCGKEPVPEGMCRMGCGRKVAPGTYKTAGSTTGRPFTTCCQLCPKNSTHTKDCIPPS